MYACVFCCNTNRYVKGILKAASYTALKQLHDTHKLTTILPKYCLPQQHTNINSSNAKPHSEQKQNQTQNQNNSSNNNNNNNDNNTDDKEQLFSRIRKLVHAAPVMLFMKGTPQAPRCGFSRQVVEILKQKINVQFSTFDILSDQSVRTGLKQYSNWPTFPQL